MMLSAANQDKQQNDARYTELRGRLDNMFDTLRAHFDSTETSQSQGGAAAATSTASLQTELIGLKAEMRAVTDGLKAKIAEQQEVFLEICDLPSVQGSKAADEEALNGLRKELNAITEGLQAQNKSVTAQLSKHVQQSQDNSRNFDTRLQDLSSLIMENALNKTVEGPAKATQDSPGLLEI